MKDLCKEKVTGLIPAGDTNPFRVVSEAGSKRRKQLKVAFHDQVIQKIHKHCLSSSF